MSLLPSASVLQKTLYSALPDFASIAWVEKIGSTNVNLMQEVRNTQSAMGRPALLGAHTQTSGRGRAGRRWENPPGSTLMFSCAYDVFVPPARLPMLAPVVGIVACEQLRKIAGPAIQDRLLMKWPNDILYDQAKLSGLLVESTRPARRESQHHHVVIVGMGMNLSSAVELTQHLGRKVADWTSVLGDLSEDPGRSEDIALLVARIARAWRDAFAQYEQQGFAAFMARHAQIDALREHQVNVIQDGRIVLSGAACGVNQDACLLVESAGQQHAITIGDISIRPEGQG